MSTDLKQNGACFHIEKRRLAVFPNGRVDKMAFGSPARWGGLAKVMGLLSNKARDLEQMWI